MANSLGETLEPVPLPRPDPRGIHPDDIAYQMITTAIPSILNMRINPAAWEAFLAAHRSTNVERAPVMTPFEEAQAMMGQRADEPSDVPIPPREPNEMSYALGYGGIVDPRIQAIVKTIRRVK